MNDSRFLELKKEIESSIPHCEVDLYNKNDIRISAKGFKKVDSWVHYPPIKNGNGIPRTNIPFRPWTIIGIYSTKEWQVDEIILHASKRYIEIMLYHHLKE